MTAVYLETGKRKVLACARDWPGWARPRSTARRAAWHALGHAWEIQGRRGPG